MDRRSKSDMGRIVYGGGAVTPDIIIRSDTLTSPEQKLLRSLAPKAPIVQAALQNFGLEQKGKIRPDFVVTLSVLNELFLNLPSERKRVLVSSVLVLYPDQQVFE